MLFDPLILKYAPWAVSKVSMLELCPKQFHLQYIEKIKPGPKSSASLVGTIIHSILEEGLKNPNVALYEFAQSACVEAKLMEADIAKVLSLIPPVRSYIERTNEFIKKTGVYIHDLEKKLAISFALEKAEFFDKDNNLVRGILDQVMITKDQIAILVDHKSGKKKKIDEYGVQCNVYRILICAAYPQVRGVQCGIHHIGSPKLDWTPRPDRTMGAWTRREVEQQLHPWLEHYLHAQVRWLEPLDEGKHQPRPGWPCEWCGFSNLCEEGKQEILRRQQKRMSQDL